MGAVVVLAVLLLVGDIAYAVGRPSRGSGSHVESKATATTRLREESWYVRVALLLVAVWAVWLLAFVVWAWSTTEWRKPAANDEVYLGYTVMTVIAFVVVAIGVVAAIQRPGWGAIGGGLVVTLVAALWSDRAVTEVRHWGELALSVNEDRGSPWVPLDSLDLVPYWVLLGAGVLLLVGGVAHVAHPTHGSTPHAGTAT